MLARLKQAAAEREGLCLSTKYVNNSQLLQFECKNGHRWKTTSKIIFQGCWCRKCFLEQRAKRVKVGIEIAKELAHSRGGECLSDIYENNKTLMHWRCREGHEWLATYGGIKTGNWCSKCADIASRHDIRTLQRWAGSKKGKLLSNVYNGIHAHYEWQCEYGHIWSASFGNIFHQNTWCPYCAGKYNYTLQQIIENMKIRNGVCFIDKDAKSDEILTFQCAKGHKWNMKANHVFYHNCWCPQCPNTNENYCRRVFEKLFGREFSKCRPKWIVNPLTNKYLELDGYCEYESLAFEYDGIQHAEYTPFFHDDENDFTQQRNRDKIKKECCDANDIVLINIPHTCNNKQSIDNYIIDALNKLGYAFTLDEITDLPY